MQTYDAALEKLMELEEEPEIRELEILEFMPRESLPVLKLFKLTIID